MRVVLFCLFLGLLTGMCVVSVGGRRLRLEDFRTSQTTTMSTKGSKYLHSASPSTFLTLTPVTDKSKHDGHSLPLVNGNPPFPVNTIQTNKIT